MPFAKSALLTIGRRTVILKPSMMDGKVFNLSSLFSESLKLITHCPVCKVRYSSVDAKVVEERTDYNLVHVTCQNCHKAILAIVIAGNYGMNSVGVVTDLTSQDVLRFRDTQPIGGDDVLDMHTLLNQEIAVLKRL